MSLVVSRIFLPVAYLHRKTVISARILMCHIIDKNVKKCLKRKLSYN